jgi:alpha-methylacyl-CoA racemase
MGQGPLSGLKIIEFAGIGPAPFCGMLLSDLGADVVRIDRKGDRTDRSGVLVYRGRRSVGLDLKKPEAVEACLKLLEKADGLIEGFRPGVMERLGLGPDVVLARSPRLAYGRMTGWGQTGPLAQFAGHDINYISITGALHAIGSADKPAAPLNLLGDFGGGSTYLAFGLLAAILHAQRTGEGQVIDCAMTDGSASLMTMFYGLRAQGQWNGGRADNLLDGGRHYYDTYRCADGKWISIGALEPQFYAVLLQNLGVDSADLQRGPDPEDWPALRAKLAKVIGGRTQAEWCAMMEGTDACFSPVLSMEDAPRHPHNVARQTFVEMDGVVQPAPAPRFSVSPGAIQGGTAASGAHNHEALADWGFDAAEIAALETAGALG